MNSGERMIPSIVGLGKAVGGRVVTNQDIIDTVDLSEWQARRADRPNRAIRTAEEIMPTFIRPTGIEQRNWVVEGQTTSTLAAEAITQACEMAGIKPCDLKGITIATMTQDNGGTPVSSMLQDKLGLPNRGVYRDVGVACTGFLHALEIVYTNETSTIGGQNPQAAVGAEVLSKIANWKDPQTYPLFGDASGAVIVKLTPDKNNLFHRIAFVMGADGTLAEDLGVRAGGSRMPVTKDAIDRGDQLIHMNAPKIAENAPRRMAEYVEYALQQANVKPGELELVIPHQANLALIKEVTKLLNFPMEKIMVNIDKMGNTSAASIPSAMKDAYDSGRLRPGGLMAICSFAAGLSFGAAVLPTPEIGSREQKTN